MFQVQVPSHHCQIMKREGKEHHLWPLVEVRLGVREDPGVLLALVVELGWC